MKKSSVSTLHIIDIMTPDPYSLNLSQTLRSIIKTFIEKKISGAPVVEKGTLKVISVVSESDLMRFAALGSLDQPLSDFGEKLVPSGQLVTVEANDSFAEVFKRFLTKPVRRVLVVDKQMNLVGIVSRRDMIAAFLKSEEKKEAGKE